jgi:hypothetical protein
VAYIGGSLVRWIFGMLGWENSIPLPACLYNEIRKRYPSQSNRLDVNNHSRELRT